MLSYIVTTENLMFLGHQTIEYKELIAIRSDSQAALKALRSPMTTSSLLAETVMVLKKFLVQQCTTDLGPWPL